MKRHRQRMPQLFTVYCLLFTLAAGAAFAANEPAQPIVSPEVTKAVERGLKYLAVQQQEDGAWGSETWPKHTGLTAIALMGFMSAGNTPGTGQYGTEVQKGVDFLIQSQKPSGFLVTQWASYGPMYEHGLALLALTEAYGMSPRVDMKAKIKAGVDLIVKSQASNGEWGYVPTPTVSGDLSVTVCQLMALRAARNCGIAVPKSTIDRAVAYVRRSATKGGGFGYRLDYRSPSYGCSGAGLTTLFASGIKEDKSIEETVRWLLDNAPSVSEKHRWSGTQHAMYGHYYATQAMYLKGGDAWAKWYPAIRDHILKTQEKDGGWYEEIQRGGVGRVYATGIAVTILLAPTHYLPIYQQ